MCNIKYYDRNCDTNSMTSKTSFCREHFFSCFDCTDAKLPGVSNGVSFYNLVVCNQQSTCVEYENKKNRQQIDFVSFDVHFDY